MNTNRNLTIDILRGSAVLFMILTHINGRLSNSSDPFIALITHIGGTVCFTIFIFCFGYIHGLKIKNDNVNSIDFIKRGLELLFIYFFTAIIAELFISSNLSIEKIIQILTFQKFPEYTEFLIPFALLSILLPFLKGFYQIITHNLYRVIIISILFYISSILILSFTKQYIAPTYSFLEGPISLFTSHYQIHTFGILSYSLPYFLGIYFGQKVLTINIKTEFLYAFFSIFLLLLLQYSNLSTWNRWPPSIYFILYGMSAIFLIMLISHLLIRINGISDLIIYLSKYSLEIFILNVVVILGIGKLITPNSQNTEITIISYPIIIFLILLINHIYLQVSALKNSTKK